VWPLADLTTAAHRLRASVNDIMITAVSGALFALLASRGEHPATLVVSVPIAVRGTAAGRLGNAVGALPVVVRADPDPRARLTAIAQTTAKAKAGNPGSSSAVLSAGFRTLSLLGVGQYFLNHQRLVHTFETNLRGPQSPLQLAGCTAARIIPMAVNPGNVGVSFDVLSYAGELVISVVTDPSLVPDPHGLVELLGREVAALCG
jgi:hypothetical protein